MPKDTICLVLGAGASAPYGLPLGSQLRQAIIGLKETPELRIAAGLDEKISSDIESSFSKFKNAFKYSSKSSIDGFLARNSKYAKIGKIAIAASILKCEIFDNLYLNSGCDEDWYQYFWEKISTEDWDDFDLSYISIISFNYDRSLEKYLTVAAINTYGKSLKEVSEKLSKIRIIHVYGSLGPQWEWEDGYLNYGGGLSPDVIKKAAEGISVIPEARDDAEEFNEAKRLLTSASSIAFLGFGFDPLNMNRLDMKESCKVNFLTNIGWNDRRIFFSCFGLEPEEVLSISSGLDSKLRQKHEIGYPNAFYNDKCKTFLRKIQFF